MPPDAEPYSDRYWQIRDNSYTAARSRERAAITLRLLGEPCGRRLFEFGCGPGWSLDMFRNAGCEVRGGDVSSVAVDEARRLGLDVERLDMERDLTEELLRAGEAPEVIVALEVLEHLLDPEFALRRMSDMLADSGLLVVSLPNEISLPARLKILFGRLPFGGHADPHVRHFDLRSSRELFRSASLSIVDSVSVHLLPPRCGIARTLLSSLPSCFPGLFSLATVYLLRREEASGQ